jgi:hypothetical protein
VAHVQVVVVAARLAAGVDHALLGVHLQHRLGVLAVLAQNEPAKRTARNLIRIALPPYSCKA